VIADLSKAISSLEGAIAALEDSKNVALPEIKRIIRRSVALADALDLSPKHRRAINALLQTSQDPDVPETDYEFHSQGIIDLLQSLLKDFNANKADKVAEEEKSQAAHDALMEKKRAALKTAEEGKESTEEAIEECKSAISKATETLVEAEAALKDDQLYLTDLTERCESKAKDWDQRSKMRADEIAAISKALEIISGVKDKESARALLLQGEAGTPVAMSEPAAAATVALLAHDGRTPVTSAVPVASAIAAPLAHGTVISALPAPAVLLLVAASVLARSPGQEVRGGLQAPI